MPSLNISVIQDPSACHTEHWHQFFFFTVFHTEKVLLYHTEQSLFLTLVSDGNRPAIQFRSEKQIKGKKKKNHALGEKLIDMFK